MYCLQMRAITLVFAALLALAAASSDSEFSKIYTIKNVSILHHNDSLEPEFWYFTQKQCEILH